MSDFMAQKLFSSVTYKPHGLPGSEFSNFGCLFSFFPVYRAKWSDLGTLPRRYNGCMKNMRWDPKTVGGPQSVAFRNLEFFEAYLSNGLEIDGPDYRE